MRASGLEDFTAPIKVFSQTTLQCKLILSVVATRSQIQRRDKHPYRNRGWCPLHKSIELAKEENPGRT
jgi:hypothetical protein